MAPLYGKDVVVVVCCVCYCSKVRKRGDSLALFDWGLGWGLLKLRSLISPVFRGHFYCVFDMCRRDDTCQT